MNFNVIGLYPENAIGHVLKLYDNKSDEEKIKLLLSNRLMDNLKSGELPKNFLSGRTIDINTGELLGLSLVVAYHNWQGEKKGNTYQVVVGVEDSVKDQVENLLSDGAIWHDQSKSKMLYQQVMVQGYYPKTKVTTQAVINQINKKIARRADYPENCGLIVNIYSEEGEIDFKKILDSCKLEAFNTAFAVLYKLPGLNMASVMNLDKSLSFPEFVLNTMPANLKRYPRSEEWGFNYADAKHYRK